MFTFCDTLHEARQKNETKLSSRESAQYGLKIIFKELRDGFHILRSLALEFPWRALNSITKPTLPFLSVLCINLTFCQFNRSNRNTLR